MSTPPVTPITPEQIVQLRKAKGWSQADLARTIGCNPSTVSRLESGRIKADGAIRKLLEHILGTLEAAA